MGRPDGKKEGIDHKNSPPIWRKKKANLFFWGNFSSHAVHTSGPNLNTAKELTKKNVGTMLSAPVGGEGSELFSTVGVENVGGIGAVGARPTALRASMRRLMFLLA